MKRRRTHVLIKNIDPKVDARKKILDYVYGVTHLMEDIRSSGLSSELDPWGAVVHSSIHSYVLDRYI